MLRMLLERARCRGDGEALAAARVMAYTHQAQGTGIYNILLARAYRKFLQAGQSVIDIGAHVGLHTHALSKIVGSQGHVIAFEAIPEFATYLHDKFVDVYSTEFQKRKDDADEKGEPIYLNVDIRSEAVGAKSYESAPFAHFRNAPGLSGLVERAHNLNYDPLIEMRDVKVTTLDAVADSVPRISFVKMDIEGGEVDCLRGARKFIALHRPIFSAEYSADAFKVYGHTPNTLYDLAFKMRYLIFDLFGNIVQSPEEWRACLDYIWDFFLVPAEHARSWSDLMKRQRDITAGR